ncbi:MAG: pentapeptide repeat-containing protein [Microcoleus sp. PH2017_03_ELD_O_A]|uniref:pentapeptide repeat-containing protein n=2 Tax=unclassified Microcoleus TaxID=2642155 RepID=UPI001DC1C165|nr:pentapeptide repeat-containing protein [Microcoleus sp. PH2017_18_LLB_O_A]MCC3444098.1 pentapeptide repeat-containing protein [Microcoleus sp. PH2017_03_ELD_O_A]MCC3518873.1 pentapeptide repeat-containing protein [Microcoleus sp. PH2017_18_LLB_O_A]
MNYSDVNNFSNQVLCNRSFRGQVLNGADFGGADVRGCNFRNAQLEGANFIGAKIGLSGRQFAVLSAGAIAICVIVGDVLTRLILGTQGQVPGSRSWPFVLLLYGVLGAAGIAGAIARTQPPTSKVGRLAGTISAILSGALLGFFYAGTATKNNSQAALAGMAIGGVLMFFVSSRMRHQFAKIAIVAARSVATYGGAFLFSATASAFLSTQKLFLGTCFALLSLLYFWFSFVSFSAIVREIANAEGTSFTGANLSGAKFDRTDILH